MNWLYYFKKEGGVKYILRSAVNGTLFISIIDFLFLGRTKKALEILRLSTEYKLLNKLRKKNYDYIEQFKKNNVAESIDNYGLKDVPIKTVWICWWQGLDKAPVLVRKCYDSVEQNFRGWKIVVITLENYKRYVSFPNYIEKKWKEGLISLTHMSDLLRVELLSKFGGLWLDATVYVTSPDLPSSIS